MRPSLSVPGWKTEYGEPGGGGTLSSSTNCTTVLGVEAIIEVMSCRCCLECGGARKI